MESDFFLIHRMKQGDEAAVEEFVRKYYEDVLKYCVHRLSDHYLAEDICQETFLRFFEAFEQYVHQGKAKNYLYVIAGNLIKNEYRKPVEMALEEETVEEDKGNNPESMVQSTGIQEELDRLPQEQQEVLYLYYYQEMKLKEIASQLGISLSLVKYRLGEGKKKLRKDLGKEEDYEWC